MITCLLPFPRIPINTWSVIRYAKGSRISAGRTREIVRYFVADPTDGPERPEPPLPRPAGMHPVCLRSPAPAVRDRRDRRKLLRGAADHKAGAGAAPAARPSSSVPSSVRVKVYTRLSRTAQNQLSKASSGVGWICPLSPDRSLPQKTEWRYSHRHADKYQALLQYLRQNPFK